MIQYTDKLNEVTTVPCVSLPIPKNMQQALIVQSISGIMGSIPNAFEGQLIFGDASQNTTSFTYEELVEVQGELTEDLQTAKFVINGTLYYHKELLIVVRNDNGILKDDFGNSVGSVDRGVLVSLYSKLLPSLMPRYATKVAENKKLLKALNKERKINKLAVGSEVKLLSLEEVELCLGAHEELEFRGTKLKIVRDPETNFPYINGMEEFNSNTLIVSVIRDSGEIEFKDFKPSKLNDFDLGNSNFRFLDKFVRVL